MVTPTTQQVYGVWSQNRVGIKSFKHVKDQYQPHFLESKHGLHKGVNHVQTSTSMCHISVQNMIIGISRACNSTWEIKLTRIISYRPRTISPIIIWP